MRHPIFRCSLWAALVCALLCSYNNLSFATEQGKSDQTQSATTMASPVIEKAQGIVWHPYEDGFSLAKAENKKTFLYFYTARCHYCRLMDTKTFTSDQVIALLNNHFIPVRVNLDEKQALRSQYQVRGVPTSWFLESSGARIGAKPGYLKPEQFAEMLQFVIDEKYK